MVHDLRKSRRYQEDLLRRVTEEAMRAQEAGYILPLHLGLVELQVLIVNLQVALRHPSNVGLPADGARDLIQAIVERLKEDGFPAHAELAEVGNDPRYDT